jgi:hypothetical protein
VCALEPLGNGYSKSSAALRNAKDAEEERLLFTVGDAEDFEGDSPVIAGGGEEGAHEVGGVSKRGIDTLR